MKPQTPPQDELSLFQAHFDQILNPNHPLVTLAGQIDWAQFDATFGETFCEESGAPAKATRLIVGLLYLKYTFDESDESVLTRWVENPYWQYFCGYTHMQHKCPIHPTSLTKWRQRVDESKLNELLTQTIEVARQQQYLPEREIRQATVDTTVQESNITYPTDSKLLYKAVLKLGKAAKKRGIALRQSYVRVGKAAAIKAARYAHAKQFKRMKREIRKLRTYVGRLIRDIRRKTPKTPENAVQDVALATLLERCQKLVDQRQNDSNKLYSLDEPETRCISKGKAHKRYEFGQKVALATTNRGDWFLAARLCEGNPYDGHTLKPTLEQVESNTGKALTDVYVDKGYQGHDYKGPAKVHRAGTSQKRETKATRKRRKRRSAIEPKIGHAKFKNRMRRCYLKGLKGDAANVVLAAAGANMRKLLRRLPCAVLGQTWSLRLALRRLASWLAMLSPAGCTGESSLTVAA